MRTRYKHKISYWVAAAVWLVLAIAWAYIAVVRLNSLAFVQWFLVMGYIALAIKELYSYFKEKDKLEK
ncbi:MAG: hypothetical protein E7488_06585 [Ruminococcaceae bacterium]|nr:hypothetical protein [Oscillospiraceae bacterium]